MLSQYEILSQPGKDAFLMLNVRCICVNMLLAIVAHFFVFSPANAQEIDIINDVARINKSWEKATPGFEKGLELLINNSAALYLPGLQHYDIEVNLRSAGNAFNYVVACDGRPETKSGGMGRNQRYKVIVKAPGSCVIRFISTEAFWVNVESVITKTRTDMEGVAAKTQLNKKAKCNLDEVTYSDRKSTNSYGDGNEKISPFEYVRIRVKLKNMDKGIQPRVTIESKSLVVVGLLPHDPLTPNEYSVIVTPKMSPDIYSRTTLDFTVNIDCEDPPQKIYQIPYLHKLGDDLELTKVTETIKAFDFKSKEQLDEFLSNYPNSARAPIIFAIRMKLLREGAKDAKTEDELFSAINAYNEFIQKYPDTTGAQVATHEVFQAYKRHDSVAAYTEFLKRYPFSLEAHLAEEHIKRKMFDSTMAQDDITAYDEFIGTFPEAEPYISQIIKRAEELKRAEVKNFLESLKQEEPLVLRYKREDYASDLYKEWDRLTKQPVSESNALLIKIRLNRIESVLSDDLHMTPSYQTLVLTKRIDEIKSLLVNLDGLIQKNHSETLTAINEGFQKLHAHIDQRFDALNSTLNRVEERLKRQEAATDALNKRLDDLNALIDMYYTALKQQSGDLKEALASMKQSGLLDTTLSAISVGLDVYNAFQSPYVQEKSKVFNLNFSPDVVINHNKNKKSSYFKISSWIGAACPTISTALVATTSVTGPIAVGAGMLTNTACKWGVSWLSSKFSR